MKSIKLYSDGSCLGNPGPGGWATILRFGDYEKMLSGGKPRTTNNHMELTGVIAGLKALKYPCEVEVITDSRYVVDSVNKGWIFNWQKYNFHGRPNAELWQDLVILMKQHKVTFTWIKGHAGHEFNERCDKEAVRQSRYYQGVDSITGESQLNTSEKAPAIKSEVYPWAYDGPLY